MCKQLTPRHKPSGGTLSLGCTHLHPGITPLTARSRLAARATDAKICLWQIKHRRVQTAAVGLCRGVYVFVGRVELCPSSGLCSGVCRQPQWVYVGVFMYSLAGWAYSFLQIMFRRVQTAAVGLCRGVYVFVDRVVPVMRLEIYYIIHVEMFSRLFMSFSAGCLCIFNRNVTASQSDLYPILHARHYPPHNPKLPSRAL